MNQNTAPAPAPAVNAPRLRRNRHNRVSPMTTKKCQEGGEDKPTEMDQARIRFYKAEMKLADEMHLLNGKVESITQEIKLYEKALFKITNPFCRKKSYRGINLPEHLSKSDKESMMRNHLAYLRGQKKDLRDQVNGIIKNMVILDLEKGRALRQREKEKRKAMADQYVDFEVECEKINWKIERIKKTMELFHEELRRLVQEAPGRDLVGVKIPSEFKTVEQKTSFLHIKIHELMMAELRLKEEKKTLIEKSKQEKKEKRDKSEHLEQEKEGNTQDTQGRKHRQKTKKKSKKDAKKIS